MSTEKKILEIIELIRRDDSVDAPPDAIRWAGNLFRTRAVEPRKSLVKKLLGVLRMEVAPNKAAFGERSTSATQARQMLYQAGDNAVDLRIEPLQKGFRIRGQVLGEGFAGAPVRLFNDAQTLETNANELSEFSFDSMRPGEYELAIHGETYEISLKAIDIGGD